MMKVLMMGVLAVALVDPGDIRKINTAKAEAKKAYLAGDFKTAIEKYRYLTDSVGVDEEEVRMNLANAYFQANDTTQAYNSYLPITQSKNPTLKSVAHQQMGVLNNRQGKFEEALNDFKQALKANPKNEDARFNYEMVKKKLEEKKKQDQQQQDQKDKQQQDQNKDQKDQQDQNKDQQQKDQQKKDQDKKDQEKKDQENKEQQDKEKQDKDKQQKSKEDEKKDQEQKEKDQVPPSVQEKLKDMNMSEEKAKMILEAMKAQEVQYLQQNKRKATKPKDKGKPDW